jgi:hypothetical protein
MARLFGEGPRLRVPQSFRRVSWTLAPGVMADRAVRWNEHVRRNTGAADEAERYVREHGLVVSAGPFTGLVYPEGCEPQVDALAEKLGGRYELELHPVLREALSWGPETFLDIGAADGYYAVGFARAAGVPTVAFEPSPRARAICIRTAEANGVVLTLRGAASARVVRRLKLGRTFLISDCEGAEAEIFAPAVAETLRNSLVVIEAHEPARPGVTSVLTSRFRRTHDVDVLDQRSLDSGLRNEPARWLVCRPR